MDHACLNSFISVTNGNYFCVFLYLSLKTYAEMDPTTAALEKEHEAVSSYNISQTLVCIVLYNTIALQIYPTC